MPRKGRLSTTSTTFLASACTSSASKRSTSAKSFAVRRSVTCTARQPKSGSEIMNRFAVPLRTYSQSNRSGRPGSGGSGRRASPTSCLLTSSRHTTGRRSSNGRW
jgi:hypothetical protein